MLLCIRDLHVRLGPACDAPALVEGVSLDVSAGAIVALVGESGCGKSLTALAIMRLLPTGVNAEGRIELDGENLLTLPERDMQRVRGGRIGMVFQEPLSSLNPLVRIGEQIAEALRIHGLARGRDARRRAIELLREAAVPAPDRFVDAYPHELSGGLRQRAMIAMALACGPALLIADEPTTALDVTVQAQIMARLSQLRDERGLSILLITHDLALVANAADQVCIMYAGRIVERGPTAALFAAPRHPYTRALLRSSAGGGAGGVRGELPVIPGEVPRPLARPAGCAFHPRCDAIAGNPACLSESPPLRDVADGVCVACWNAK